MQKVSGGHSTARVLNNYCFSELVKQCVANDDAFRFMNSVKGTPSYWKEIKMKGPTIIKALCNLAGVPNKW